MYYLCKYYKLEIRSLFNLICRWLHNGKNVDLGHRYSLNHNTGVLSIGNIRLDDNGIWQCVNEKQLARAINLVVLGKWLIF